MGSYLADDNDHSGRAAASHYPVPNTAARPRSLAPRTALGSYDPRRGVDGETLRNSLIEAGLIKPGNGERRSPPMPWCERVDRPTLRLDAAALIAHERQLRRPMTDAEVRRAFMIWRERG
jgi:hypothetical protein